MPSTGPGHPIRVIVLDEIDKLSTDFKGDPSSALLEVLDPEQNTTFHDNYLDIDYDLSNVLFLTTANSTATIQPALRDRMEMINVSGYLAEEKMSIAKDYLIPKQLEEHGIDRKQLRIDKGCLEKIISEYTPRVRGQGPGEADSQDSESHRQEDSSRGRLSEGPEKGTPEGISRTAYKFPRQAERERGAGSGHWPCMDRDGRGNPVHRKFHKQRQGHALHDRKSRGRDEGVRHHSIPVYKGPSGNGRA